MVKSGLAGRPQLASGDISITDVQCTAPGHCGLTLGPELAGARTEGFLPATNECAASKPCLEAIS